MIRSRLKIPRGKVVAVDTETTGLNVWCGDRIFAISLCNEAGATGYVEWPVNPHTREVEPYPTDVYRLRDWLADSSVTKVFHNAKFDLSMFRQGLGLPVAGPIHDTMLAMFAYHTAFPSYGLKELGQELLNDERHDQDRLYHEVKRLRPRARRRNWDIHPESIQADYWLPRAFNRNSYLCQEYAVQDVKNTMRLWCDLPERLKAEQSWETYELEQKLMFLVLRMEERGVRLDIEINFDELRRNRKLAKQLIRKLRKLVGDDSFNPNSGPQVRRYLFETMGLEPKAFTDKGTPKTDQESLAQYSDNPFAQLLMEQRAASKAANTFFMPFLQKAVKDPLNEGGYCIHPTFRHTGQRTGRFSCSNPNLQAVADDESSRSENPISARKPFGPRPGYIWVAGDYSQLEARIYAAASGDPVFQEALEFGRDFHTETANAIWGGPDNPRAIEAAKVSLETASDSKARKWLKQFDYDIVAAESSLGKKTWRARAKSLVFSRIMGGGPNPIMEKLHCTEDEARRLIKDLDQAIPGIRRFLKDSEKLAWAQGYSQTLFGRRLHHLRNDPPKKQRNDFWKAGPYIVQGTAADLVKRRMLACDDYFRSEGLDAHIVLQIHDELIFEIRCTALTGRLLRQIKQLMEDTEGVIDVDLPVDLCLIRRSWSEKEPVDISKFSNGRIIPWKGKYATVRSSVR